MDTRNLRRPTAEELARRGFDPVALDDQRRRDLSLPSCRLDAAPLGSDGEGTKKFTLGEAREAHLALQVKF